MGHSLRSSTLVPRGFVVYNTGIHEGVMLIAIRPASTASLCPGLRNKIGTNPQSISTTLG